MVILPERLVVLLAPVHGLLPRNALVEHVKEDLGALVLLHGEQVICLGRLHPGGLDGRHNGWIAELWGHVADPNVPVVEEVDDVLLGQQRAAVQSRIDGHQRGEEGNGGRGAAPHD